MIIVVGLFPKRSLERKKTNIFYKRPQLPIQLNSLEVIGHVFVCTYILTTNGVLRFFPVPQFEQECISWPYVIRNHSKDFQISSQTNHKSLARSENFLDLLTVSMVSVILKAGDYSFPIFFGCLHSRGTLGTKVVISIYLQ